MPVQDLPPSQNNADFFLTHARPGMFALISAQGRLMPELIRHATGSKLMGGPGRPSFWSHSFVIADVVEAEGWKAVILTESTLVPESQLLHGAELLPGQPDWDGPQWSILVARHSDGRVMDQYPRKRLRRYANTRHSANVALVDTHVPPERIGEFTQAAACSLLPEIRYARKELIGVLIAALRHELDEEAPLETDDVFCSAYVRGLYGSFCPAIDEALGHIYPSNTTCQHLYQAAVERLDVLQIVRDPDPGEEGEDTAWARAAGIFRRTLQLLGERNAPPSEAVTASAASNPVPPWRWPGVVPQFLEQAWAREHQDPQPPQVSP